MTRDEFLENVTDFYDLKDFCSDVDCEICYEVYDEDGRDEEIEYYIGEYRTDMSWRELRDRLSDIPTGYEFYREDGAFDWVGLDDDDFADYKERVLEYADDHDLFDMVDDDEDYCEDEICDEELDNDEVEDDPVEDEDFSVKDLIGMCSVTFVAIQQDNLRRLQDEQETFSKFVDPNAHRVLR